MHLEANEAPFDWAVLDGSESNTGTGSTDIFSSTEDNTVAATTCGEDTDVLGPAGKAKDRLTREPGEAADISLRVKAAGEAVEEDADEAVQTAANKWNMGNKEAAQLLFISLRKRQGGGTEDNEGHREEGMVHGATDCLQTKEPEDHASVPSNAAPPFGNEVSDSLSSTSPVHC